jgi:hypothetical protein
MVFLIMAVIVGASTAILIVNDVRAIGRTSSGYPALCDDWGDEVTLRDLRRDRTPHSWQGLAETATTFLSDANDVPLILPVS